MELNDIQSLRISLASPEQIRAWSHGEVTKPETINYRRLRPEKDGLFCEAIFGPTKDWQCYCGKYKKVRFKGIVCDKCGVEVTHSRVRRERMGHIELATPIAHIWYTRRSPSYLGLLLNISQRNLDRVLYYAQYIVTSVDEAARDRAMRRIDEEIQKEVDSQALELHEELASIEAQLAERAAAAVTREEDAAVALQQRRDEAINTVMSEATRLRELLEAYIDRPAPDKLVFAPSETLIVPAGEVIRRENISALNTIVQDELSRVEERIALERDGQLKPQADEERFVHDAEQRRIELLDKLETITASVREKFETDRESLDWLKERQLLNETTYRDLHERWPRVFTAAMGAEAIYDIVAKINLDDMAEEMRAEIRSTRSKQRRKKAIKRLQIAESLNKSGNRPEWMILKVLPVIPPALRPMVQLDGGRFATSDLNDLYRRVVNRNNRLKHLIKLQAPEVIVRNEKRMLQEAVDSLIDNSRRGKAISLRGRRQLKSLSDMLKGKQGRFRRNLLGKRVDYSGRSVIVVGPQLKLHQCGLPKRMALELFRPFVMQKLVEYNHSINAKGAKRLIEREEPEVWEVLEEVIKTRPVLLNRAPTLHRLGIQAFEPVLVEGSAIQIHPLVCSAFNADFDGDQMAVHVPLSEEAIREARELMLSSRNLLRPANGEPEVGPSKDMVLGCYYLTMERDGAKGEGMAFSSYEEVDLAYQLGKVELHAKIKYYFRQSKRHKPRIIDTTVGRVIFNESLPQELRFKNQVYNKGDLKTLIAEGYEKLGIEGTAELVDAIKDIGFLYAMRSGITIAVDDIHVPAEKAVILEQVSARVAEVERQYRRGLITDNERYRKTIELWTEATDDVSKSVGAALDPNSSLGIMVASGATKGGMNPIRQLAGMRGLMAAPSGRIIPLPIQSNFREGLTSLEYFISTHGSRKGLADTALRTADAGYLTRRLVDVSHYVIVNEEDCGTTRGITIDRKASKEMQETLAERIAGRYAAEAILDPKTLETWVEANGLIDDDIANKIEESAISSVRVRSPMTCANRHGVCVRCYGRDLGRGEPVRIGEAVGIVAAQSIGEPGTQLTLRTFHTGGVAGASDITQGLPRVQELFEARIPKGEAIISEIAGKVEIDMRGEIPTVRISSVDTQRVEHSVPGNFAVKVEDGDIVEEGQLLASRKGEPDVIAKTSGRVSIEDGSFAILHETHHERSYDIPATARLAVYDGQVVEPGELITDGSKNPHEILSIQGLEAVREYIVAEVQKVYRSQGVSINDKHIEIIARQMLRRVMVVESGDSELLPGEYADRLDFEALNQSIIERGGEPAQGQAVLLGITKAALNTDSFLSAASFQHTISVLASAAIEGRVDELRGLKESVLVGKLIPAGTGFEAEDVHAFRAERAAKAEADAKAAAALLAHGGLEDSSESIDDDAIADTLGELERELMSGEREHDAEELDDEYGVSAEDDSQDDDDSDDDLDEDLEEDLDLDTDTDDLDTED